MKKFWVVFVDSNSSNVVAFFADSYFTKEQAEAWRDANYPDGDVREARIDGYELVNVQMVDF